jgi:hypothetical protein
VRIVERREHAGHFFGNRRDVIVGGALGRQARNADLQCAPCFEHLVAREAVQRGKEAERLAAERRRPIRDERSGAVSRL